MILVTGGTGLVGSHLLYHLSLKNDAIKALRRKNSNLDAVKQVFKHYRNDYETLINKIIWVEADITDVCALEEAFLDVTHVYHSAALVSFNPKDYKAMRKINIEGTSNIVNLCIEKNIKKLCFVSSIATIEKTVGKTLIDEDCEWSSEKNNYGYAITKYGAEMEVWRASQEGVPLVIVNPGVIFGVGNWNSGFGAIFNKIYNGLPFYSDGVTGFVSVNDVVISMILLMNSEIVNQRFLLVSENKSFKSVFSEIAQEFGKKAPSIKVTPLLSSIGWRIDWLRCLITGKEPILTKQTASSINNKQYYSSQKIKTALNFEFEPVSDTLKQVCKAFLNNRY